MTYHPSQPLNKRHKRHMCHGVSLQMTHASSSVTEKTIKSMGVTHVALVTGRTGVLEGDTTSVTVIVTQASRTVCSLVPMPRFVSGWRTVGVGHAFALCGDTAIPVGLFLTLRIHHFSVSAIISCLGNQYPRQAHEDQVSNDRDDENGKKPKHANNDRRYDLARQQNRQWRNENCKKVIHRNSPLPDCRVEMLT